MALDVDQDAAVNCKSPVLSIEAGPGTGKTIVMASRIASMLANGVDPSSVLALTYTSRARNALYSRVADIVGPLESSKVSAIRISTFHSFSLSLLEERGLELLGIGPPVWTLLDQYDQPRFLKDFGLTRFSPSQTRSSMSRYRDILKSQKLYDFDMSLELAYKIAKDIDCGIRHIFVDEFQDTTESTWRLLRMLRPDTLTVVGDRQQEIYNFRPDHLHNPFQRLRDEFPTAAQLRLRTNYRSTRRLIADTSRISNTPQLPAPSATDGYDAQVTPFMGSDQLRSTALEIKSLLQDGVYSPGDIACLFLTNREVQAFTAELNNLNISSNQFIGRRHALRHAENSFAYTLWKYAIQPHPNLFRWILRSPVAPVMTRNAYEQLVKNPTLHLDDIVSLERSPRRAYDVEFFSKEFLPKLTSTLSEAFSVDQIGHSTNCAMLTMRKAKLQSRIQSAKEVWDRGMRSLTSIKDNEINSDEMPGFSQKFEELLLFLRSIQSECDPTLPLLPELVAALHDSSVTFDHNNCVTCQTIHSAKGWEWPVVFLTYNNNTFFGTSKDHDFQRRLLFVGATRARKRLFVSTSDDLNLTPVKYFFNSTGEDSKMLFRRYPRLLAPMHARLKSCRPIATHLKL